MLWENSAVLTMSLHGIGVGIFSTVGSLCILDRDWDPDNKT